MLCEFKGGGGGGGGAHAPPKSASDNNNNSYNTCPDFKNLCYARKFNSLIIASDSRICPDKIDSLKSKPSKR